MGYVESFYLEPEATQMFGMTESNDLPPLENLQELASVIDVNIKEPLVSDYCGLESDDIPPIYRAQLRAAQKEKIIAAEQADKSFYAYEKSDANLEGDKKEVEAIAPVDSMNFEYYVPGFSPPPQNFNDDVQKMSNFQLPKMTSIEATENVFKINGAHEKSQYVLMENEDPNKVNSPKKTGLESLISYTASDVTSTIASESSCLTATLGPAFGCLPITSTYDRHSESKYKGLSAFRPVTKSIESQYAMPELN